MIVLMCAVREEIRDILKWFKTVSRIERGIESHGRQEFSGRYLDQPILLVQAGIGRENAQSSVESIAAKHSPAALLFFGYCGALEASLKVGDLVICQQLRSENAPGEKLACDPGLIALAEQAAQKAIVRQASMFKIQSGTSLTATRLINRPQERRSLAQLHAAQVVEMENSWAAQAAAQRGIPFLAVRSVSDGVGEALPPLDQFLDSGGAVKWKRAAQYFLAHPGELAAFPRLWLHSRKASRSLGDFLQELVPLLVRRQ
jgi:adenosylhomocysteine nucleosidase